MDLIRPATPQDAAAICSIYNPYVTGTAITFEEQPVSIEAMQTRITEVIDTFPWLVLEEENVVLGYAYAMPWRARPAYRFSVETTIYLGPSAQKRGFGSALYRALIEGLRGSGLHSAIGGIALPNTASLALHEKLGFKKVAHFSEVGWKFGRWIDVGYWQLNL